MCYGEIAIKTENYEVCNRLSSIYDKEACYSLVASATNNLEWCDKIMGSSSTSFSYTKANCYSNALPVGLDPSKCENLDREYRDNCYAEIGIKTGNESLCNKISNFSTGSKEDCYFSAAIKTNNSELCNKTIFDYQGRKIFTSDYQGRDNCYLSIFGKTKNINVCLLLSSIRTRNNCLSQVAIITKNSSICNLISLEVGENTDRLAEKRSSCLNNSAIA